MYTYELEHLPYVSMTGKTSENRGWSHSGRRMNVNLLVVFHSGECTFSINDKITKYKKGDIAIIPKDTYYCPNTETHCDYTFFHFDGELVPCDKEKARIPVFRGASYGKPIYGVIDKGNPVLLFDNKINMGDMASDIELMQSKCINTQYRYNEKMQLLLALHFSEMLFYISQAYCEQFENDNSFPPAVNRIVNYIQENYTQKITLDDICKRINISKQYCMRLFKKYLHTTINEYVLDVRMRHAAYLLRHTYMNVNEAANYLGFSSASYFSRVFKKFYGIAPSDYFE